MRPLRSSGFGAVKLSPNTKICANLFLSPGFLLFFFVRTSFVAHMSMKDALFENVFIPTAMAAHAIVYMTAPSKRKRSREA